MGDCISRDMCEVKNHERSSFYPAFSENNIVIVLSSSDYFAPYLGVCVKSILMNANNSLNYDIIVIERGITEGNKKKILSIVKPYNNASIRFFNVKEEMKNVNFYINSTRISQETYYGLLVPFLLTNYSKAIIMDCDMIVKEDLAELFNVDLENNIGGGVNDVILKGWLSDSKNDTKAYYLEELGIKNPFKCVNGGLILLNFDAYRKAFNKDIILHYINNYKLRVVDQDIFNILLENKFKLLDVRWNHMIYVKGAISEAIALAPKEAQDNYFASQKAPFIIHFASENKPWANPELEFAEEFWLVARQTVFYEVILARMVREDYIHEICICQINHHKKMNFAIKEKLKSVARILFPVGTYRRSLLKKIYFKITRGPV